MTRAAYPLPEPEQVKRQSRGFGHAASIRRMYADRFSLPEIEAVLGVSRQEIRRTLHRPVRPQWGR